MSLIEFVFKLILSAWPFVKEMVLDGKSLREAFRANRRRALFSIAVMVSIVFNVLNIGADIRFASILYKYVDLERSYKTLKASTLSTAPCSADVPTEVPLPVSTPAVAPAEAPVPLSAPAATKQQVENYEALQSIFRSTQNSKR